MSISIRGIETAEIAFSSGWNAPGKLIDTRSRNAGNCVLTVDCRFSTDEFPIRLEPMTDSQTPRWLGRSVLALFAGFVQVVVLSILTDVALHVTGIFPPLGQPMASGLLLIATAYRTVFSIAGSYTTARLGRGGPCCMP
jgi:hypothetical protein